MSGNLKVELSSSEKTKQPQFQLSNMKHHHPKSLLSSSTNFKISWTDVRYFFTKK